MRARPLSRTWRSSTTIRRASWRTRRRQHRWVRGDWQILWWLFPFVPSRTGPSQRNRLPLISRWKILDNLRRSLMAPATVAAAPPRLDRPAGHVRSSGRPFGLAAVGCRSCLRAGPAACAARRGLESGSASASHARRSRTPMSPRVSLQLAFLANQAWEMLHAITVDARAAWHHEASICSSGRRPRPARHRGGPPRLLAFVNDMIASPSIGLGSLAVVVAAVVRTHCSRRAGSRALDRCAVHRVRRSAARCRPVVRRSARKTASSSDRWRAKRGDTSRRFVGPEDHALPPDNVQLVPGPTVAHRTSPTNIGHGAARDARGARPRASSTPTTSLAGSTPRSRPSKASSGFEGHLLNWYDTRTLAPLLPRLRLHGRQRQPRRRALDAVGGRCASLPARRSGALAVVALFDGMNFGFLYDPQRQLFAIGYRLADDEGPGRLDSVVLRLAGFRGAVGQLSRDRQGRRPGIPLVSPGTSRDQRPRSAGPAVVERHDVRVPDAAARHAQLSGHAAR